MPVLMSRLRAQAGPGRPFAVLATKNYGGWICVMIVLVLVVV